MNHDLLNKLSAVTDEEKKILAGEARIDRSIYMDGTRDVISGDKLLPSGRIITIRPHTRFGFRSTPTTMWKWCTCAPARRVT